MRALATIGANFEPTGRDIVCGPEYGLVQEWLRTSSIDDLLTHGGCLRFRSELAKAPRLGGGDFPCFRGCTHIRSPTPASDECGPPEAGKGSAGRYNPSGRPVLYLSDATSGVERELHGRPGPVWVQKFVVPTTTLTIADLRPGGAAKDDFTGSVMWFAELAGSEGYPDESVSRAIAEIVADSFDGMLVAGVRGDSTLLYSNLVLFRPHPCWRSWLPPASDPWRLR